MSDRRRPDGHDPDDGARLAAALHEHYAPPPLSPARRQAFDAELRTRLAARRARRQLAPALGAALAAAAIAALLLLRGSAPPETPALVDTDARWQEALLEPEVRVARLEAETLPPEHAAIASIFLGR